MKNLLIRFAAFYPVFLLAYSSANAQEYAYDSNGNLLSDANKKIVNIHYNILNLPDTILYADGRKIIYTYTGSGQKLKQQVFLANGTLKQKRDYIAEFQYERDTLREIHHDNGRLVPILPGSSTTNWEYQYHLADHLGNVRSTLTSRTETETSTATFETSNVVTEQNEFLRYNFARRINAVLFDHTKSGATHYSQRLNGSVNEKYGMARSLSVMPGDTIELEVYAKYADANNKSNTQPLITLLAQIASGAVSPGTVADGAGYATNGSTPFPFAGLNNTSVSMGSGPKAYMNWVVFDRNFVFKTGGYVRMTTAGKENGSNVPHEKLFSQLIIKEPGYVYVYLSNEETTPVEVYFDDFSVTQVNGPVIQQSDYDPFGLAFNEYTRENSAPNSFLYNGKELQKDFDLNWYDYGARMYDAALGRWHVVDPKADKYAAWSPYNYVVNNPVKFIDPDGMEVESYKNGPGVVTAKHNRVKQAMETVRAIPTGRKVLEAAGSNKSIRVFTSFYNFENPNAPRGVTTTPDKDHPIHVVSDKSTQKSKLQVNPKYTDSAFKIFEGMDVTDAVSNNQKIYVVIVNTALGNQYNWAEAVIHEIAAHILGDMGSDANALLGAIASALGITETEAEHLLYGQVRHTEFNTKTGERSQGNTVSGSEADHVANELAELASERAEKKKGKE